MATVACFIVTTAPASVTITATAAGFAAFPTSVGPTSTAATAAVASPAAGRARFWGGVWDVVAVATGAATLV